MRSVVGLAIIPALVSKVNAQQSVCSGSTEFLETIERQTFAEHRENCQLLGEGYDIASITSLEEDSAVRSIINAEEKPFIGLFAESLSSGGNPKDFVFVDGRTDGQDYYDVNKGNQPWRSGEPNNAGSRENCVHLDGLGWNDIPCDNSDLGAICRRDNSPRCDLLFDGSARCHEGSILALIPGSFTFDEGREVCKSFTPDSDIIIIEDEATNEAVRSMFSADTFAFIGARAFGPISADGNASDFHYVDDRERDRDFFTVPRGQYPWLIGEPNNFRDREEDCLEMRAAGTRDPGWNDIPCDDRRAVVCEVPNAAECANGESGFISN